MNRWHINHGTSPRDKSAEVAVIWACNVPARHTYKVGQLIWALRGWTHDIQWFCKANEVPTSLPWEVAA